MTDDDTHRYNQTPPPPHTPAWAYSDTSRDHHRPETLAYTTHDTTYGNDHQTGSADPYSADSRTEPPQPLPRASFDPGVDLLRFVGGAVITAVIAALAGYLGVLLINLIAGQWIPESYWESHTLVAPQRSPATTAWIAAAAAILAAGIMWTLLQITNRAGMFFTALAALIAAAYFLAAISSDPWQTTLGIAALGAILIATIGGLTAAYTRQSTTTPERY